MVAAMMLQVAAAGRPPLTAEQAMAAHRAATGIGRDPCRPSAKSRGDGDAIVVCGRRESPYALPGYDPMAGQAASQAGGGRKRQMADIREASGACASQAAQCLPPMAGNLLAVLPMLVVTGVEALIDDE